MTVAESGTALAPSVPSQPATPAFPRNCPTWCTGGHDEASAVTLGTVAHMSAELAFPNPDPLDGEPALMFRVQLFRMDRPSEVGATRLYLCGETDVELNHHQVELLLVQARAFFDLVEILGRYTD